MNEFWGAVGFYLIDNLLGIVTLILAYFAGHAAAKINRKNKIADVVMHCIDRYDAIARDKALIENKYQAHGYYRRYFGLKSDQFDYWLSGLIDAENISSWLYSLLNSFEQGKRVHYVENGEEKWMTFHEGWEKSKTSHDAPNIVFVRVIERIQELSRAPMDTRSKYYELISLLCTVEKAERDVIKFADISFINRRIRGGDMRAFQKMERKHHTRAGKVEQ
ncbi:hypothetical protein KJ819_03495 [Patescibacteria group bacterium]|nr:hypothetical protein [Patescibacteria group bacterium]MBU1500533.1 hypothetical protein [Patescibacteria group bacterium]MBU2080422.1 hypothetical protein [Patescibacteria group bacterium]MBU2123773.1 hypothetical protein [Patescibacteria group bacterium]MBU2194629.1 hypothetical protein [Patescibacteria group bacterium]